MKSSRSTSNNSVDSFLNPHPPNDPFHNKSESSSKMRQRRYTHQISDQKNDVINFDNREIKSAGSNSDALYSNKKPDRLNYKSKISSAPSPRSRICHDYRSNTIHREESSGLYTFNSIPSLIPDTNDSNIMPRTKRKENVSLKANISNSKESSIEPKLSSLVISKSMNPCKSEASPVTSTPFTLRVLRRSLQQLSKEKLIQRSRKSTQSSLGHSKWLENHSDFTTKSSLEVQNNEPINLSQYRLANDLSESFENRVLASLVAQNAHEVNLDNNVPKILPRILNSQDFSKFAPRTETALMCGSYSDEESSATTTAPFTNNKESGLNLCPQRYEMHNEWKSHINCSQDTSRSIDFINSVTDSYCNSTICDETNTNTNTTQKTSRYQDYLLVRYIPEFGCFYDPETGTFYELTF